MGQEGGGAAAWWGPSAEPYAREGSQLQSGKYPGGGSALTQQGGGAAAREEASPALMLFEPGRTDGSATTSCYYGGCFDSKSCHIFLLSSNMDKPF